MTSPVVIVDPVSSGTELAPAFAARGVPAVAVRSARAADSGDVGYANGIRAADFLEVHDDGPGLVDSLREFAPRAVIAGSEAGVRLADKLAATLTPMFGNAPELSLARRHKAAMQDALANAGLPVIRTLSTGSAAEVAVWLVDEGLRDAALVVKPPESAGSDNVHHIPPGGDWRPAFDRILAMPTALLGERSETVIVQEQVTGTEYAVDTVSARGQHALAHLIRYSKTSAGQRMTVFDHTEFIALDPEEHGALVTHAFRSLDALGIRWGAAHSEIVLTKGGPRLIETGARMCGGPVLGFARAATGSSQLERVIQAYTDGEIHAGSYAFSQTVVPVFLIAPHGGVLSNVEVLDVLHSLPTHLATHMWRGNGDRVPRTVDFDTTLGIVALAGNRDAVFADYHRVRQAEARLVIVPELT
jgi:biotin carboxylase